MDECTALFLRQYQVEGQQRQQFTFRITKDQNGLNFESVIARKEIASTIYHRLVNNEQYQSNDKE